MAEKIPLKGVFDIGGEATALAEFEAGDTVPTSHLPDRALSKVTNVADTAARLALTPEEGDIAIQSDDDSQWLYDDSQWVSMGGGVTTHGDLNGLGADDHTQYILADGTRAFSGDVDVGGNAITNVGNVDGRDVSADGIAQDDHIGDTTNPHSVTKAQVGLSDVPNLDTTSAVANDHTHANKAELDLITDGDHDVRTDNPHGVTKTQVGLSDVPNLDTTAAVAAAHTHANKAELDLITDGDHDVRTDNPHGTTIENAGDTDITAAAKGDMLVYDGTNWVDLSVGINGDVLTADDAESLGIKWGVPAQALTNLPAVSARRTATLDITTTQALQAWTTIPFNASTDVENDTDTLEHSTGINPSRILIKEDGAYLIGYAVPGVEYASTTQSQETFFKTRVIKNGSTIVNGTEVSSGNYWSNSGAVSEDNEHTHSIVVELAAGDYIEVQAYAFPLAGIDATFTATVTEQSNFYAIRLKAIKGEKGDTGTPGSGTTISLREDNVDVANTPHQVLNFESPLSAEDAGSGVANIGLAIPLELPVISTRRITTTQAIADSPAISTLEFQTTDIANNTAIINKTSDSEITAYEDGIYFLQVNLTLDGDNNDVDVWVEVNGTEVLGSRYTTNPDSKPKQSTPGFFLDLNANDVVTVHATDVAAGNTYMDINSSIALAKMAGFKGEQGIAGADGDMTWEGEWSSITTYSSNMVVEYNGSAYVCIATTTNNPPPNATYWELLAEKGDIGSGIHESMKSKQITTVLTTSSTLDESSTPTTSSGVALDNLAITKASAGTAIRVEVSLAVEVDNDAAHAVLILHDGTNVLAVSTESGKKDLPGMVNLDYFDTTKGAGTHTYYLRVATNSNNLYVNRTKDTASPYGGFLQKSSSLTLSEVTLS